jgi:hypothetical protein
VAANQLPVNPDAADIPTIKQNKKRDFIDTPEGLAARIGDRPRRANYPYFHSTSRDLWHPGFAGRPWESAPATRETSPARSGDELAGLAAASAEERARAQMKLADVPLKEFLTEPVIPCGQIIHAAYR